jgi:superfamily II DNA or RNA helicase
MPLPTPWPHQNLALDRIRRAAETGVKRMCLCSPTGSGKSLILARHVLAAAERGEASLVLTHRKSLVEQLSGTLTEAGVMHGVRAAGYRDDRHLPVQISSFQTEIARCVNREEWKRWKLHPAKWVIVDEAHCNTGPESVDLLNKMVDAGATVVGFTATPIDIGHFYEELIQVAVNSELRRIGAVVAARHYACSEPTPKMIALKGAGEDPTEKENTKAIMVPGIFGHVYDRWKRHNPHGHPTVGFGPGLKGSLYFAEEFWKKGVRTAHIDGDDCWANGEWFKSSPTVRAQLREASRTGEVQVVWNYFVMREGVDWPWLRHGIMATVYGSFQSYIQSGGRLLRAFPGKDEAVITDHGGNFHRHGSLNADRVYKLSHTNGMLARLRADGLRYKTCQQCGEAPILDETGVRWTCRTCGFKNGPEPCPCPQCDRVLTGRECVECGFVLRTRSRKVFTAEGDLVDLEGAVYKPRVTRSRPDTQEVWKRMYYRARASKKGMTFTQAEALFAHENHYWPPRSLRLMPRGADWYLKVRDVPPERLR